MQGDPFETIAVPPPALPAADAEALVLERYGIDARAKPLVSERDQNFLLTGSDGRRAVLKIANAAEDRLATEFQIDALLHVEATDATVPVPRVLRTLDGDTAFDLRIDKARHRVRVVSWLDGAPLARQTPGSALAFSLGATLGRLNRALADFRHPGERQPLLWDMSRAPALKRLLPMIRDPGQRRLVERVLDEFSRQALPRFASLQQQVIHNDANPDNLLVDENAERITGIIDFGDMVRLPRVVELAVAAAYLRAGMHDPPGPIADLVRGYASTAEIDPVELDLLPLLVRARLATTIAILEWRRSLRGADDEYLVGTDESESAAWPFLQRLESLPDADMAAALRAVLAA